MPRSEIWFLIAGAGLVVMALGTSLLRRLPVSTAMLYLATGAGLGPFGLGWIDLTPASDSRLLEHLTEVAVIVSLFTVGLKLRVPLRDGRWLLPVRLAVLSMVVTVGLIAGAGMLLLGLPLGAAVVLGGILAPTDPVLASDVQIERPWEPERLRFALSGEGGLNDGTAFPLVMLGLGLLGAHDLGTGLSRWLAIDVLWATAAGLAIGGGLGTAVSRLVLYLRRRHREAVGADEFLTLGLIALSYGLAITLKSYGFLAVFAAGLAFRRVELLETDDALPEPAGRAHDEAAELELATDPVHAPKQLAQAVLGFNEQLERIGEVVVVVLVGAMLGTIVSPPGAWLLVALILMVVRPVSVHLGLLGRRGTSAVQRRLIAWFGIRGIGSVYYLAYAIEHGLPPDLVAPLAALTLLTVAVSVVIHGMSVTPLMRVYGRRLARRRMETPAASA